MGLRLAHGKGIKTQWSVPGFMMKSGLENFGELFEALLTLDAPLKRFDSILETKDRVGFRVREVDKNLVDELAHERLDAAPTICRGVVDSKDASAKVGIAVVSKDFGKAGWWEAMGCRDEKDSRV